MGMFRAAASVGLSICFSASFTAQAQQDWPAYGGRDGTHHSTLSQINRGNVKNLVVAWKYDTQEEGGIEANPIIIGKVLYTTTPGRSVVALDAATGKLIWKFASDLEGSILSRGVSYWSDGHQGRIFAAARNYLYALDATTGKVIPSFGEQGRIDLRKGLREPYQQQSVELTTPGSVYKDLIVVGGANPETTPHPRGTFEPSTFAPELYAGPSTPFLIRASLVTTPGPGTRGKMQGPPTTGPA